MNKIIYVLFFLPIIFSCNHPVLPDTEEQKDSSFEIITPEVKAEIQAVTLSTEGKNYNQLANGFALKLLPELYGGKSTLFSPLSLQMALSMTATAAKGKTLNQMLSVLEFQTPGLVGLNAYSRDLLSQLPAVDISTVLSLSNAVIFDNTHTLNPSFKSSVKENYFANVSSMDFADANGVLKAVNDWCYKQTNGLIPIILEEVHSDDVSYLVNALYFKASWTTPFDPNYQIEKSQPFNTKQGNKIVDYLCSQDLLRYAEKTHYQVASYPLGKKGVYEISVFLPKSGVELEALLAEMALLNWSSFQKEMIPTEVNLWLPKFEVEGNYKLRNTLIKMGMPQAFEASAQFDFFSPYMPSMISEVIQKSKLSLDEKGIEAASATLVEVSFTSAEPDVNATKPIEFHANHPFAFVISERTSGTILFVGVFDGQ